MMTVGFGLELLDVSRSLLARDLKIQLIMTKVIHSCSKIFRVLNAKAGYLQNGAVGGRSKAALSCRSIYTKMHTGRGCRGRLP